MTSPVDRAQALRAAGVVLLSGVAAVLAADAFYGFVTRAWLYGAAYLLLSIAAYGGVYSRFRAYLDHSPRHKGRH